MPTAPESSLDTLNGIAVQSARWAAMGASPARVPVLMLHGWGASIELLRPLAERLAQAGHSVHALDMPGFGGSPAPAEPWKVRDYAALAVAYCEQYGLEAVNLFGHSFGGRLSLYLGAEQAHRIRRMALANSAGVRPKAPPLAQVRLRTYKAVRDGLRRAGMAALADRLQSAYNARYGSADFKALDGVMRQTLVNVVNEDMLPYARRVAAPTLLLWGDQDTDTPLWQGQALEQAIPDAGLVVYKGAGHYSYLDRLPEVARVIDHFYRQEGQGAEG